MNNVGSVLSIDIFWIATIICNLFIAFGWLVIYKQRKFEGRAYYKEPIFIYSITYFLLILRNVNSLVVNLHNISHFQIYISYIIYFLQFYATYKFIYFGKIKSHK